MLCLVFGLKRRPKFLSEIFLFSKSANHGRIGKFSFSIVKSFQPKDGWHICCGIFGLRGHVESFEMLKLKKYSQVTKIVLCEHLGFLAILVLCFLDDLLKLPSLVFSNNALVLLHQRSTLEMLLILAVW